MAHLGGLHKTILTETALEIGYKKQGNIYSSAHAALVN